MISASLFRAAVDSWEGVVLSQRLLSRSLAACLQLVSLAVGLGVREVATKYARGAALCTLLDCEPAPYCIDTSRRLVFTLCFLLQKESEGEGILVIHVRIV